MGNQGVVCALVTGLLGLAVLVGCSTTTTTTAELTYLHSPVRVDPPALPRSGGSLGDSTEVDRDQTRLRPRAGGRIRVVGDAAGPARSADSETAPGLYLLQDGTYG